MKYDSPESGDWRVINHIRHYSIVATQTLRAAAAMITFTQSLAISGG